jgi:hypothetical protein
LKINHWQYPPTYSCVQFFEKKVDAFVWHTLYQVYVTIFLAAFCLKLHLMMQANTGFYVLFMLNEAVVDGIKALGIMI